MYFYLHVLAPYLTVDVFHRPYFLSHATQKMSKPQTIYYLTTASTLLVCVEAPVLISGLVMRFRVWAASIWLACDIEYFITWDGIKAVSPRASSVKTEATTNWGLYVYTGPYFWCQYFISSLFFLIRGFPFIIVDILC